MGFTAHTSSDNNMQEQLAAGSCQPVRGRLQHSLRRKPGAQHPLSHTTVCRHAASAAKMVLSALAPPQVELDLAGADFCGSEGELAALAHLAALGSTCRSGPLIECRPEPHQTAAACAGAKQWQALSHPHLWLPGIAIEGTGRCCPPAIQSGAAVCLEHRLTLAPVHCTA